MKLAVIGTSNIGAVKYAEATIAAAHPGVDLTCYGLPGGKFDAAHMEGTRFGPARDDAGAMRLAVRVNGASDLDLDGFDHVLVIADTLGMPAALWMAASRDIADWPGRTGRPLLSEPAYLAGVDAAIATRADHLRTQFGGRAIHVALAPYPTEAVVPKGPLHQMPYAAMARHTEAARIERLFHAALHTALAARNMCFVAQPPETIARPFLTHRRFGEGALDFRNAGNRLDDHRHMNADFGASLFNAFVLSLGASPVSGPQKEDHSNVG